MIPIQVILQKRTTEKRAKHRLALTAVFDCVRLSGKQGIALRGHGDEKKQETFGIYCGWEAVTITT